MTLEWYDVEQNSEEWFDLRKGVITSSNFDAIMSHSLKDGKFNPLAKWGETSKEYAHKIALERITNRYINSNKKLYQFERGHKYEPMARSYYEKYADCEVESGGFYKLGDFGDSPDGIIKHVSGSLELKVREHKEHGETIKRGFPSPSKKWQYIGHILIGDKDYCDYGSFCPEYPEDKRIKIYTIHRDNEKCEMLWERLEHFNSFVEKTKELILNGEG